MRPAACPSSRMSRSMSRAASGWPSSGRTGRASRRSCACWQGLRGRAAVRCSSRDAIYAASAVRRKRRLACCRDVEAPADTTVRRLVGYGRFPYRSHLRAEDPVKDREAVDWSMQVTHVEALQDRQVQSLSGGERQRAFLAMVLAAFQCAARRADGSYLDMAHQLRVVTDHHRGVRGTA